MFTWEEVGDGGGGPLARWSLLLAPQVKTSHGRG